MLPTVAQTGESTAVALAVASAAALAAVHLFAGRLFALAVVPRSQWLSLSGGVAVAYVFVHLLPEIRRRGAAIESTVPLLAFAERNAYLVALLGFVAFYGLERFVQSERPRRGETSGGTENTPGDRGESDRAFWLHVGSFAVYNALVGYLLLHREETGLASLATFAVAMALHFVVNDYGLREYHGRAYRRYGRWLLAGAVLVGLAVGYVTTVGDRALAALLAFLGGGVVLNVVKEELPAERESRFAAFAAGALGYALVLLVG